MIKKDNTIVSILEYILACLVIIECNTLYKVYIPNILLYGLIIIILFVLLLINKKDIVVTPRFIGTYMLFILYGLLPYSLINHPFYQNLFLLYFFGALPLLYFYFKYTRDKLALFLRFATIMSIISFISSICWLLCSSLKIVPMNQSIITMWGENRIIPSFYYIYFETQNNLFLGLQVTRNSAIFTEAPMFGICLSVALCIEVFLRPKLSWKHVVALLLGIITSTSTTSFILTILVIVLQRRFRLRNRLLQFTLFLIITISSVQIINNLLYDKMSNNSQSYDTRTEKITEGYNKFLLNPVFGGGFMTQSENNSNSIMTLLSESGLYIGLLFIYALFLIPIRLYSKKEYHPIACAWLIFFIGYCFTIITYNIITLIFIAYMLTHSYRTFNNKRI